jgi:hypothetical protein
MRTYDEVFAPMAQALIDSGRAEPPRDPAWRAKLESMGVVLPPLKPRTGRCICGSYVAAERDEHDGWLRCPECGAA